MGERELKRQRQIKRERERGMTDKEQERKKNNFNDMKQGQAAS